MRNFTKFLLAQRLYFKCIFFAFSPTVIFGFLMYTTDYVHLLCMKICPLYERFVNKEDQDEKTPSKSNFYYYPKKLVK